MKTIEGFDNYYITFDGNVINKKTGRNLKHAKNQRGYSMIMLSANGRSYTRLIHRLVYSTFVGKLKSGVEINHINGCKSDNSILNLEQITHKENMVKATETGLIKSGTKCRLSKAVDKIDVMSGNVISSYGSARIAEKATGVHGSSISNVCNGVRITAGGFKWKFSNAKIDE